MDFQEGMRAAKELSRAAAFHRESANNLARRSPVNVKGQEGVRAAKPFSHTTTFRKHEATQRLDSQSLSPKDDYTGIQAAKMLSRAAALQNRQAQQSTEKANPLPPADLPRKEQRNTTQISRSFVQLMW